jgi:hypothetical protein
MMRSFGTPAPAQRTSVVNMSVICTISFDFRPDGTTSG